VAGRENDGGRQTAGVSAYSWAYSVRHGLFWTSVNQESRVRTHDLSDAHPSKRSLKYIFTVIISNKCVEL
jgi:hypothetical protein